MCPPDQSLSAASEPPAAETANVVSTVPSRARSLSRWLLLAGFALAIFGAKLWLIDLAGSDLPWWDQWDAEAEMTLRPWLEGKLTPSLVFHPHNEHRLVLTKLYALGLFVVNGQWDARLETVGNAAIHVGCALAFLLIGQRLLPRRWLGVFGALLFLLYALPFSPDNTLVGFQIQFYLLLLLGLGHSWLTLTTDRFGKGWALGQLCAVLTLGTMASGFFSSLAVIAVSIIRLVRTRRWTHQQIASFAIATTIAITGLVMITPVANHASIKAHSLAQFLFAFDHVLTWPGTAWFPATLVLVLPMIWFGARCLWRKSLSLSEGALLGLLLWNLLQSAALAYGRGGFGTASVLTNRYLDLYAANVAVGFLLLVALIDRPRIRGIIASAWLFVVVCGLAQQTHQLWRANIVPKITQDQRREEHVRNYLQSGDPTHLLDKPLGEIPYPDGSLLLQRLTPSIQAVLPASVRRPVPVLEHNSRGTLPPELVAPAGRLTLSTWGLAGTTMNWRSDPQSADTLPVLRFQIAGDLGAPGRSLRLVVKSSQGDTEVFPNEAPGARWKTVQVFRPLGAWWIEVSDTDPDAWFAFCAPVELGRGSWLAAKLVKHHIVLLTSAGVFLLVGAFTLVGPSRWRSVPGASDGCPGHRS